MPSDESLMEEAKQTLDQIVAEGYVLRQIKFEPMKGCRICQTDQPVRLTVIFAGTKIEEAKVFLYCMAKVCIPCLAVGEAEESLTLQMLTGAITESAP